MEPRGVEESVVVFPVHQKKTLRENVRKYMNCGRRGILEIDEIKENIRLKIRNGKEGPTKGMNGDKTITNVTEHQNRYEESNNADLDKTENKTSEQKEGNSTQLEIS
jgi:hypothetical protein